MSPDVLTVTWDDLDVAPEAVAPEWIESHVPMRKRVLPSGTAVGIGIELPEVESIEISDPHAGDAHACESNDEFREPGDEEGRTGTAAVAWAVAYRDGLEQGRTAGYSEGFARGLSEGRQDARLEGRARAEQALAAMAEPFDRILSTLDEIVAKVAGDATALGFGVAEAILEKELVSSVNPGGDAISRAARLLPDTTTDGADQLTIRLNPDDVASLDGIEATILAGRTAQIVADPDVTSGDCRMELGATRLDASVSAALARVRSVLSC